MSNFYYQGKIKQENYLTQNDILLRSIYGKYEIMISESILILLYGVLALIFYLFPINGISTIPFILERVLGSLLVGFGVINLIVYYFVIRKEYGKLMIGKAYLYLILGGILLIFPTSLQGFIYRLMASLFIAIGVFTLINKNKGLYQKAVAVTLILIGIFFIFIPEYDDYKNILFFIIVGILGIYLLYNSIRFRRNLKRFEDEERGFTDYTIE